MKAKKFLFTLGMILGTRAYSSTWAGKNLLACTKSFGTTVVNYTGCKFGPALIEEKSDFSLRYSLTYTYQCNGGRLNFGLSFGEGSEAVFQRMENGSTKREMVFEGHGPLQTLDNKPSNTDGALFAGLCIITIDSLNIGLTSDSQKLFSDYNDLIVSVGSSNAQLKLIDSNTALLGTLLATIDFASLGPMILNIRDNLKTMIEARDAIVEKTEGTKESLKSLKLVLIDIDTQICQNPTLKVQNSEICGGDHLQPSDKTIEAVLTELQSESSTLLSDNTDLVAGIVSKLWSMTAPISEMDRVALRGKVCESLKKANLSSGECSN